MNPAQGLWIGLVHHPVLDRAGSTVTTSVTNLDVHDLSRSARTYGLAGLVVITPIEAQRRIVKRIVEYWNDPEHAARIPGRREALGLVRQAASLEEAIELTGPGAEVVGTSARGAAGRVGWAEMRREIASDPTRPRLLVLGTGWGLAADALAMCHRMLEPIGGERDYNHLSVRSAGAIALDRLLGSEGPQVVGT
jgi:hypothetical protein